MSGYDVLYWFSDLWYDLTHLGTASLPEVGFKLVMIFFGSLFAKAILGVLWRVFYVETLRHIIEPIFKLIFFPFRLPWIIGRWIKRKSEDKQRQRDAKRYQQEQDRQLQLRAAAEEEARIRMHQQQIAESIRLQNSRKID